MRKPLVRFARRLASWESSISDDDLLNTEFKTRNSGLPDLQPSVYEVCPADVLRAFAEHATAFDPPDNGGGIDLTMPLQAVRETAGDTGFSFTMGAHREIVLKDRDDLQVLVREARTSLSGRKYEVKRAEIFQYARTQLSSGNTEWLTARGLDTAKKWLKKIPI